MTIQENLKKSIQLLKQHNIEESILLSRILLSYVIKKKKEYLIIHSDEVVKKEEEKQYYKYINQLINGKPVQYITNNQEFMKLNFFVNEHVLIPRADTEILVEEVLKLCNQNKKYKILDLCTGSGAIGISIAKNVNKCEVILSDISSQALKIAQKNVETHCKENKVEIIKSDMFQNISGKFDIIVSNPPYIETRGYTKFRAKCAKSTNNCLRWWKRWIRFLYRYCSKCI